MSATVSRHFVAEKVKALCVVSDVCYTSATALSKYDVLPAVASGGWDNEVRLECSQRKRYCIRDYREHRD